MLQLGLDVGGNFNICIWAFSGDLIASPNNVFIRCRLRPICGIILLGQKCIHHIENTSLNSVLGSSTQAVTKAILVNGCHLDVSPVNKSDNSDVIMKCLKEIFPHFLPYIRFAFYLRMCKKSTHLFIHVVAEVTMF